MMHQNKICRKPIKIYFLEVCLSILKMQTLAGAIKADMDSIVNTANMDKGDY